MTIAEEEEVFPRRKEGQRECNRLIGLYATGVRCTLPASGRWLLLHQDAAQRSDTGEDILGVSSYTRTRSRIRDDANMRRVD